MHYLTGREDTPFWKFITNELKISDKNKYLINASKFRNITPFDIQQTHGSAGYALWCHILDNSGLFNRDLLIKRLYFHYGIQCIVQYYPLYKYPLFKNKGLGGANCQNTENFYRNMISFPFHIWMNKKELNYMIRCVIKTVKELSNKIE
jgi:dTDP-4-amino-4,6-dideoxygalactose transaminase